MILECPMIYCNVLGFIPALSKLAQNVCRKMWCIITLGNASSMALVVLLCKPPEHRQHFTGKEAVGAGGEETDISRQTDKI